MRVNENFVLFPKALPPSDFKDRRVVEYIQILFKFVFILSCFGNYRYEYSKADTTTFETYNCVRLTLKLEGKVTIAELNKNSGGPEAIFGK